MPPDDTSVPPPPPPIPDYTLLNRIGRGSYGDVWLARSTTGLFRAVKIVWRSRFGDNDAPYEREFNGLREFARITAGETQQLSLLHVGRNDHQGFFYYIMEVADDVVTGREIDPGCYEPLTFRTYRDAGTALPIKDVVQQGIELARGLAELHSTGHIHRDIKPSNIIVVGGRPKLADIGLITHASNALTIVGTEGFMPPEGPGSTAADIYSFGKVLYEIATGRDRHDFPRLPENFDSRDDHRELLELNEIILRACATRPEDRYASVEAMLSDLQLLDAGRSVRRLRRAEAGLARARKWVVAAAAIAAVAGIGAYLERQRADIETSARREAEAQLAAVTRRSLYESSIANAQRALATDEYGEARQALDLALPRPGDPDLRGFEWYALHREAQGDPAMVLRESGGDVERICLSPDERFAAIDDASTDVQIYEIATGRLVQTVSGIHRLAGFTPDGQRLVGTNPQYELETWSVADGTPDPRPNRPGIFRPIAVAASTPRLLYFQDSLDEHPHRLAIQNLDTGEDEFSWSIAHLDGRVNWDFHKVTNDAEFTHIALLMVHGLGEKLLYLTQRWRLQGDQFTLVQSDLNPANSRLFSISSRGDQWLTGLSNRSPVLVTADQEPRTWERNTPTVSAATRAISPDGRWALFADRRRLCLVTDIETGGTRAELRGLATFPHATTWMSDSHSFLAGSAQGDVRLWSIDSPTLEPTVIHTKEMNNSFASRPLVPEQNGSHVFVPGNTQESVIVDLGTSEPRLIPAEVQGVFLYDSGELWGRDKDQLLVRQFLGSNEPPEHLDWLPPHSQVREANASPNGRWIVVSSQRNHIVLWDRSLNAVSGRLETDASTIGLTVDNLGHVIFVDFNQRLQKWDLQNAEPRLLQDRRIEARPPRIEVSPDNRWLLIVRATEKAEICRNEDLRPVRQLANTYSLASGFAFHPDSHLLAGIGAYGTVRLIRLEADDRWVEQPPLLFDLADQPGHESADQLAFSRDGKTLMAHMAIGRLRLWRR